jgi:hypothetical protein
MVDTSDGFVAGAGGSFAVDTFDRDEWVEVCLTATALS